MAATFGDAIREQARCRLRTSGSAAPSDFVSRTALANLLHADIGAFAQTLVIALIRRRQCGPEQSAETTVDSKRRAA